jgi:hypothetical protein
MRIPSTSDSPSLASDRQSDAVLQATGIVGLGAVAVIHFAQVVPTTEQTPWLGAAFVVLTLSCIAVAAQLLHRSAPWVWLQVAVLNILTMAGYAFTRLVSTTFDNADVGHWSETLGVAALFIEGLLVVLSVHVLKRQPLSLPDRRRHEKSARAPADRAGAVVDRSSVRRSAQPGRDGRSLGGWPLS